MQILIIEDEDSLREGLLDLIRAAGHEVDCASTAAAGLDLAAVNATDLVLLDLMLPDGDGIDVCSRLREQHPQIAILMLTARGSENDKVKGLNAGADDYVTKPFGARELLARIEAIARRTRIRPTTPTRIEIDGSQLDLNRHLAQRGETQTHLTPRESAILHWLYHQRQRAVSRAELLEQVWGTRGDLKTRTVDMTIANLRQKIELDPADPQIIKTVTGVGYAWGQSE
ncbi:MAG: response regulator transcription factor [bacterium]|nr:response regulator transcription factor [bacterium]